LIHQSKHGFNKNHPAPAFPVLRKHFLDFFDGQMSPSALMDVIDDIQFYIFFFLRGRFEFYDKNICTHEIPDTHEFIPVKLKKDNFISSIIRASE
jgi:hypothetical protein